MRCEWAADSPRAPRCGEQLCDARAVRWDVVHVGRFVWLSNPVLGLRFVRLEALGRYTRRQLSLSGIA